MYIFLWFWGEGGPRCHYDGGTRGTNVPETASEDGVKMIPGSSSPSYSVVDSICSLDLCSVVFYFYLFRLHCIFRFYCVCHDDLF